MSFSKFFDIPLQTKFNKKSLKIPKSNQNPYVEEEQTTQWQMIPKSNQNPYVEEEQTTQWPKDTKE